MSTRVDEPIEDAADETAAEVIEEEAAEEVEDEETATDDEPTEELTEDEAAELEQIQTAIADWRGVAGLGVRAGPARSVRRHLRVFR